MNPNPWFKIAFILIGCLFCAFLGWEFEHLRFVEYIEKQDAIVAQKVQKNKDDKQADSHISKEVIHEKQIDINAINQHDFSSLRPSSPYGLSATKSSSERIDYQSAYRILAKQCATTTVDYDRLVEYLEKQQKIYHDSK
jgi:hypothetical protein